MPNKGQRSRGKSSASTVETASKIIGIGKRSANNGLPSESKNDPTPPRRIVVPGAPDFNPHLERLLKCAGIANLPNNQAHLDNSLKQAWLSRNRPSTPPSDLLDDFDRSIRNTQRLLRQLAQFSRSRDIAFHLCPVGEGTISVETLREMKTGKPVELPRQPPPLATSRIEIFPADGMVAAINVSRLLDRVRRKAKWLKRRRGRQPENVKANIVACAADFCRRHSNLQLTTYPNGNFANFCKEFYSVVTGETDLGLDALQAQIRAELKPRSERK